MERSCLRAAFGAFFACGLLLLTGCGPDEQSVPANGPQYVTTIAPFEMILSPMVEGRGTVERLLEPGTSPHTYDPLPSDVRALTRASAFLYGAKSLDGWAADVPASRSIRLVGVLPPEARLHFGSIDGEGRSEGAVDPHFWTDPVAVQRLLPPLADTLCAIDPGGCSTYRANADSFATVLSALDRRLDSLTAAIRNVPVLLAQPFYRYFLHRYGPKLVAVVEPEPGVEPTPRDIERLVHRAKESGARAILSQRQLSPRAAAAVAEPTGLSFIELDPLGGTPGRETYRTLLLFNAQTLSDSLSHWSDKPRGTDGSGRKAMR